jgi:glycosyltransferase involved in cell wall biosynthesis
MLKVADALAEAGYDVRVVSCVTTRWAASYDPRLAARRLWRWTSVDMRRRTRPDRYLRSGLRRSIARAVALRLGTSALPLSIARRAYGRAASELARAIAGEPCDLVYGGTNAALAAVPHAARALRVPYAIDLEDIHSAEARLCPATKLDLALAAHLEGCVLPAAAFVTAGSEGIAEFYRQRYDVEPIPVHNTFPLPQIPPAALPDPIGSRSLYWFSQTVGPGRGLEGAIRGLGTLGVRVKLCLQGVVSDDYERSLREAATRAPLVDLIFRPPCSPDELLAEARRHHVGLALELPDCESKSQCLSNKALLYPLAGLPVLLSDTPGQRRLATDLGAGAALFTPGDSTGLAEAVAPWLRDDDALRLARDSAWQAARRRWHWQHALERGAVLSAVAKALPRES